MNFDTEKKKVNTSQKMPVLFVSHGAPSLVDDKKKAGQLRATAERLPRPEAILVISAHWLSVRPMLGNAGGSSLIYDFTGFEEHLYSLKYNAPGGDGLSERVEELLGRKFPVTVSNRGWDHGVYIPLICMYPGADIPVLQISLPLFKEEQLVEMGRALAPLRNENILIIASGAVTHNLRRLDFSDTSEPEEWAREFDQWTAETLKKKDIASMIDFRNRAPRVAINHPTVEHFLPLLVAAGASEHDDVSFPITGFEYGNLSRRAVQFGGDHDSRRI